MATWFPHDYYREDTVRKTEYDRHEKDLTCVEGNVPLEKTSDHHNSEKSPETTNSMGAEPKDCTEEAKTLPQIHISNKSLTNKDKISLFCDEIIGTCTAEEAEEAIALFIIKKIANKRSWTAIWKTAPEVLLENCDTGDLPFIGVFVRVNVAPFDGKSLPLRVSVCGRTVFRKHCYSAKKVGGMCLEGK